MDESIVEVSDLFQGETAIVRRVIHDKPSFDRRRQRMIEETSAFLTFALASKPDLPRIPTRRLDEGGFARLLQRRGARAAVNHWWTRTLRLLDAIEERLR